MIHCTQPVHAQERNLMEMLIGWLLLLGIVGGIALVVHLTGSERGTPEATCGKGACGKSATRHR